MTGTITMTGDEYDVIITRAKKAERERDALREALLKIAQETEQDHIGDIWQTRGAAIARAALEDKP